MADLNEGVQWQQVTCSRCNRTYQCTPEDDYYGADPEGPLPGPDEGVCFSCLLALNGFDPETTPVQVIDIGGEEQDPRDLALKEAGDG
jgi:hypothetical protein